MTESRQKLILSCFNSTKINNQHKTTPLCRVVGSNFARIKYVFVWPKLVVPGVCVCKSTIQDLSNGNVLKKTFKRHRF